MQVLDAQGMRDPTGHLYQLMGIPATWLFDPTGRIIAKDRRGQDLNEVLAAPLK